MRRRTKELVVYEDREPEYENFKELIGVRENKTDHPEAVLTSRADL
jgi:hypothetical protein